MRESSNLSEAVQQKLSYSIDWLNPINNKPLIKRRALIQEQPYWKPFKYGNKWYIMTFENIYPLVINK